MGGLERALRGIICGVPCAGIHWNRAARKIIANLTLNGRRRATCGANAGAVRCDIGTAQGEFVSPPLVGCFEEFDISLIMDSEDRRAAEIARSDDLVTSINSGSAQVFSPCRQFKIANQ